PRVVFGGTSLAGVDDQPSEGLGAAVHWDAVTHVVTVVTPALSTELLRHNMGTVSGYEDPDELPPGPCRAIAIRWNHSVIQQRPASFFRGLLAESARQSCGLGFVRAAAPNSDGIFELVEVHP